MDLALAARIAEELALPPERVAATLALFELGASAPFVVRYRREAVGGLDERQIRAIHNRLGRHRELSRKREAVLKLAEEQGKLTAELKERIEGCEDRFDLDDIAQLFRPKRKSRAADAAEQGLEPLAEYIWGQEHDAWSLEEHADVYINPDKNVTSREQALEGAAQIIAGWIAQNLDLRKALRAMLWAEGEVVAAVVPAKAEQKTKYGMYYDRRESVSSIPSHRVLAIRRGTKEGILTSSIRCNGYKAMELVLSSAIKDPESVFAPVLLLAARESYTRILKPLIETEVRARLKERADREAIRVFQQNLENLLLSPAAGKLVVLGVEVTRNEECKIAVVDGEGTFLEEASIAPAPPRSDIEGTRTTITDLIGRHGIQAIAVGSGAASREVEGVLRRILAEEKIENVIIAGINDAGLTVYASSRTAREELPDLSPSARAAVSMARRLQNPLSELVKVDPKLIGVGQYQHDVDQKELHQSLVRSVHFCVNKVGADPNRAGFSTLRHISGLGDRLARRLINHRDSNGAFASREALKSVPGIDDNVFSQAAGFLRVANSENPLDATSIHPESYPIVESIAKSRGVAIGDLIGNSELLAGLNLEEFASENVGLATLSEIREELLKPGRDPRRTFAVAHFREDVKKIDDLQEGMVLEGTVTNVTNFGAFVDVGINQDGLVHLSQMSNRFIRDPREAVKVGDVVQVKVISVEPETKRIGLSMKALMTPAPKRRKPRRKAGSPPPRRRPRTAAEPAPPGSEGAPGPDGRPRGPRRPRPSRPPRRPAPQEIAAQNSPVQRKPQPEKPAEPEKSLQEKIAILQSKFRGIS